MPLLEEFEQRDLASVGTELHRFAVELYPICRSITGNGLRQSLRKIAERIPLELKEVPTGTKVFDWEVPKEWNIRDAYIKDERGNRIVDFARSSLHVVNYSVPVHEILPLESLKTHLFTLPDRPDWIPYRTSYYKDSWGFCLSQNALDAIPDGKYKICIDSSLEPGSLTYGECFLQGESEEEVLVSVHGCHPSLANDNLSGVTVATALAQLVKSQKRRYSYRFLFIPGTIGAITWLAINREHVRRIKHGLVLTCIGDRGGFHYKKSRRGDAEIDRAMQHALKHQPERAEVLEFSPYGYDERQYCSPGFNLPVGCLMRSVWGTFPEYHTSADNLEFVSAEQLARSLRLCVSVLNVLEGNRTYRNTSPYCEPQLGKRGLYNNVGGKSIDAAIHARLWTLNLSDGENSLLDIAERAGIPFEGVLESAEALQAAGLLVEEEQSPGKR